MAAYEDVIRHLRSLGTEQVNERTLNIDRLSASEIVAKINAEDATVAAVVKTALPEISRAAELFAQTIRYGGRVFYIGAGTSGRLGVLDAAECPPTYGTEPSQIIGVIAGGYESLRLSLEGAEDSRENAVADLKRHDLNAKDFVIGIAASRRTPYTLSGIEYAKASGCKTAYIICNHRGELQLDTDILIELPVGPEVITGSTRMKSGTAQKMTLNMISTTAMVPSLGSGRRPSIIAAPMLVLPAITPTSRSPRRHSLRASRSIRSTTICSGTSAGPKSGSASCLT